MADRILIIDDDDQLVDAYRDYLSESGYEVDCAQELEEAQTLLAHFSYSVVITDLRLSKLAFGGLDVIKHVRESSRANAHHCVDRLWLAGTQGGGIGSGADAFLRKPTAFERVGEDSR